MRLLLAGGGTAGHINPAIAMARYVRSRRPSSDILFIGAKGGMEEKLVVEAGFALETFPMRGFKHSLSPKACVYNLATAGKMRSAVKQAGEIIDRFKPDVILGTGGFACFPPLYAGAKKGIPTAIHESNALPGRSNRLLSRYVDRVMIGFEDAARYFPKKKTQFTGNPLREGMVYSKKSEAKKLLGIDTPLVYSFWGSLGASEMNRITAELFKLEMENSAEFTHIHSAGTLGHKKMPEHLANLGVDINGYKKIDLREYVYDAPTVMAAADVILCRAGAMTVSELAATGTPSVIIPSPNVSGHHQHNNAHAIADRGGAVFLEESDCSAQRLYDEINGLLSDPERMERMSAAASTIAVYDAGEKIYKSLLELIG